MCILNTSPTGGIKESDCGLRDRYTLLMIRRLVFTRDGKQGTPGAQLAAYREAPWEKVFSLFLRSASPFQAADRIGYDNKTKGERNSPNLSSI
jgi:hypothetical protein